VISLEVLGERLKTGLREEPAESSNPEGEALARELRLRCTEAMLLGLDRELRIAYLLGDIFHLSGEEAAEVLELDPPAFRQRLSRARRRLHGFLRDWCGIYDPANPCRCTKQVSCAIERGLVDRADLYLSKERSRPMGPELDRAASEVGDLMRMAEVVRGPSSFLAPERLLESLRELLDSGRLELLRQ
jgi:hypothetical protein